MKPSDLLQHYKTKAAVAAAIGVDRQVVQGWFERGRVPLEKQTEFEVATNGDLKADVSEEFRDIVVQARAG